MTDASATPADTDWAMLVATSPTTAWSGAVQSRMVIELEPEVASLVTAPSLRDGRGYLEVRGRTRFERFLSGRT